MCGYVVGKLFDLMSEMSWEIFPFLLGVQICLAGNFSCYVLLTLHIPGYVVSWVLMGMTQLPHIDCSLMRFASK